MRGLRRRCPQCGQTRLFSGWYTLAPQCPVCGLSFSDADGNTWGFMYYSTAFLTGLVVVAMFLVRPANLRLGQAAVGATALALILGTMPTRKSIAMAIDYFTTLRSGDPGGRALRR